LVSWHSCQTDTITKLSKAAQIDASAVLSQIQTLASSSRRTWQPDSHDEMRVAVVSSQHITREDGQQLIKADPRDVLATLYESTGHIIHSDDDEPVEEAFPPDRFSAAFRALVLHFRALGYTYLRIDAHGPVVAGLPTFEW
jgi:hypothetical protein